jgi:hypothetical protein
MISQAVVSATLPTTDPDRAKHWHQEKPPGKTQAVLTP